MIGGGLMGAGIAEVSARAGHDVVVIESSDAAAKAALERLQTSLHRAAAKGRLDAAAGGTADAVLRRIRVHTDLGAVENSDVVVEAIVEHEAATSISSEGWTRS